MENVFEKVSLPIENLGEQHLACAVLVDTSGSMRGYEKQLEEAIASMKEAIENDDIARGRVEVCLITFDDIVREESSFGPVSKMEIPKISCGGLTCTHAAVEFALRRVAERKEEYKQNHVTYTQPWIWLLTDGASNDPDNGAFEELLEAQRNAKCIFFGIAVGDEVNETELGGMHKNGRILKVGKDKLTAAFEFIPASINPASTGAPGTKLSIPVPDDFEIITIDL